MPRRRRFFGLSIVITIGMLVAVAPGAFALPGDLDIGFDMDGKVITNFGSAGDAAANALAIDGNGKPVAAGGYDGNFALARYTTGGALDSTFDTDGMQTTDFGAANNAVAQAMAIDSAGKIVLVGSYDGGFAIARYTASGALDNTFDSDGMATTSFGLSKDAAAQAVTIDDSGNYVVAGTAEGNFAVARYSTSGALDTTFSTTGKREWDMGGAYDVATGVAVISSSDKIVVGGYSSLPALPPAQADSNFALARMNNDGTDDTSFGVQGKVTTDFAYQETASAMRIQSDGKIVLAGRAVPRGALAPDFAMARYSADGVLDPTFGTVVTASAYAGQGAVVPVGVVMTNFGYWEEAQAMAIDTSGRLLAAGKRYASPIATGDFALARYASN